MKELKKLGPSIFDQHEHVVYLNGDTGQGISSYTEDHVHQVVFQSAQQPDVDPATGQPQGQPMPAMWVVQPATEDGHTHDIAEPKLQPPQKKERKEEILRDVYGLMAAAKELEKESFDDAVEAEKFYLGDQWDEGLKQELESLDRAALTINLVEPTIDILSGYQREQRSDIKYSPDEEGDAVIADILNIVSHKILERCFYAREESKVVDDQLIVGRGLFNIYVDTQEDLRGKIVVEHFPYSEVLFGAHQKEDLSDCEFLVKHKMYSKAKLEQLYPKKFKDIQRDFDSLLLATEEQPISVGHTGVDEWNYPEVRVKFALGEWPLVDIAKKEYRLIDCWRRVYFQAKVAVFAEDDFLQNLWGWSREDVKAVATIPGCLVIEKPIQKMRITKICGGVILSDEYPADLPVDDFFIVPLYAKKRGDRFYGKVKGVIDPQREINKRHSQSIDVGNKMSAYGWFFDANTFPDEKEKENFLNNSSKPGFTSEIMNLERPPRQVEGTKFPSELVQLISLSEDKFHKILNIQIDEGGANTSGAALFERQKNKMRGNNFLPDNLSFAKIKIGQLLISLIQRYWTPDRIARLIMSRPADDNANESFAGFTQADIVRTLETADLSQYDVSVTESSHSATIRWATFLMISELIKAGHQIPPEVPLRLADIPAKEKHEILQSIQAQQAATAQAEAQKSKSELNKTLIARGIIPPEVQQQLGPPPQQMPRAGGQQPHANDQGSLAQ